MMMRVKFKTKPGEQFQIRKEVFQRLRDAFAQKGLAFAHRKVTVHMPSEAADALNQDDIAGAAAEAVLDEKKTKA